MAKQPARKRRKTSAADDRGTDFAVLGNLGGADIEALAFLVLMQAAKSAQEDLKAIMAGVKAINQAKQARRAGGRIADCKHFPCIRARIAAAEQAAEDLMDAVCALDLDRFPNRLAEMSEMESLRLQMAMDRLSKVMSILANLMKKSSDTAAQIAKNMK